MTLAAWRRRPKRGARPLAALMLALVIWSLFQALDAAVANVEAKILWTKIQYIGVVAVPTAWLFFALEYTGLEAQWLTRQRRTLLLLVPVLTLLIVWTNELHGWVWRAVTVKPVGNELLMWHSEYGWAFWLHTAYSYALLAAGMLLLVRAAARWSRPYRTQAIILLWGATIPWINNILSITHVIDLPINTTAFGFMLDGIIAYWALFRYQLLDLVPVAREAVVDSMGDAMITLDLEGRVVDVNPAAVRLLDCSPNEVIGERLTDLMPEGHEVYEQYTGQLEVHDEIQMPGAEPARWLDLRISPLYDQRHQLEGRVVVLHDITDRKQLQASLEAQVRRVNQLLEVARVTTEHPTLEETMQNTLEIAKRMTGAAAGSLMLVNAQKQVTHSLLTRGEVPPELRARLVTQVTEGGLIGWVFKYQEPLLVHNTHEDPHWLTLPDQPYEAGSALGVPICYGERLLGGLILHHPEPGCFDEEDAQVLGAAARQMALALANAQVYEEQRLVAEQQTTLFEVLRRLQRPMSHQQAMQRAVNVIAQLTGWPVIAVVGPDQDGKPQIKASAGRLAKQLTALGLNATADPDDVEEIGDRGLFLPRTLRAAISATAFPSVLVIPLESKLDDMVMLVASDEPLAFDQQTSLLADSLGNITTLVLRNAQLYESVSVERQRLFALVQSSRDGIIMIGNNSRVLFVNQTAVRHLGLEGSPGDWLYRTLPDTLMSLRHQIPDVVRAIVAEMRRLRDGDVTAGEGEYAVSGRVLRWFNLPVMDGERALGRLLILHDVTRERQINQMRDDLTHAMVHDLRSPLTSIHSALWILRKQLQKSDPETDLSVLGLAERSTNDLLDLVNAILDISRLESGRMPVDATMFDLQDLVVEVLALKGPQAEQKGIRLMDEVDPDLAPVWADPQLIGRVLQNLVDNALKFTPDGGLIRITSTTQGPQRARKAHISVIDTGPGIPADIKDQLFEKFVTGQQDGHGSGLGLTFCKMVLEAHKERIWVSNPEERGAAFTFSLPLVESKS